MIDVKTETLKENDIILIKPGEKVAADGIIEEGESYLNESMLTGESKPVRKSKGDQLIAGSLNGNGSLKIRVAHGAKDSYLSRVVQLVKDAQMQNRTHNCWPIKRRNGLRALRFLQGWPLLFIGLQMEKLWHSLWSGW